MLSDRPRTPQPGLAYKSWRYASAVVDVYNIRIVSHLELEVLGRGPDTLSTLGQSHLSQNAKTRPEQVNMLAELGAGKIHTHAIQILLQPYPHTLHRSSRTPLDHKHTAKRPSTTLGSPTSPLLT